MGEALVGEHVGDLVVHRVHEGHALAEALEPATAVLQRLGVAVDADDPGLGAPGEHGLGVAAEPEGRVDHHRPGALQCRRDQRDDPVEQHRDVGGRGHRQPTSASTRVNSIAKPVEAPAEKRITPTASRAS